MNNITKLKLRKPWRDGLIIATGLSALAFASSLLWQAGHPEWSFVLLFGTLWLLISLFLANDGFNEESGMILARMLDENIDYLHDRILQLESELAGRADHTTPHATEAT